MADYQAPDTEFTAVADAIRTKGGTSAQLEWPQGFVDAVGAISGGGSTLITKTITANGTYNASDDSADGYSEVTVNVSNNREYLLSAENIIGKIQDSSLSALAGAVYQSRNELSYLVESDIPAVKISLNSQTDAYVYVLRFARRFYKNEFTKLYIRLAATAGSSTEANLHVNLLDAPNGEATPSGNPATSEIPALRLLKYGWTAEEIMAQTRATSITLTDENTIPEQLVEMDISDTTADYFYVRLYSAGVNLSVKEIYVE